MLSLAVTPTLTVDVHLPGEFDSSGGIVIYRESTDETTAVTASELDRLIATLVEARARLLAGHEDVVEAAETDLP